MPQTDEEMLAQVVAAQQQQVRRLEQKEKELAEAFQSTMSSSQQQHHRLKQVSVNYRSIFENYKNFKCLSFICVLIRIMIREVFNSFLIDYQFLEYIYFNS